MDSKEVARTRILSLIQSAGWTEEQTERRFGLRKHTVAEWKQGEVSTYMNKLPQIADEFDVSIDWLLGRDTHVRPTPIISIIGRIQAGYPIESYEGEFGEIYLPNDVSPSADVFALEVVGDSMMPIVMEGDIIICERTDVSRVNGKICVVTVDGESTLKKLKIDSTGVTLIPLNPMYKEIHYSKPEARSKNFKVDGVLIESIRKF